LACHPKDGGEGQNRTGDTTIFSPRKRVYLGQLKTAAPRFSDFSRSEPAATYPEPLPIVTRLSPKL
jgi:hypothetical protein